MTTILPDQLPSDVSVPAIRSLLEDAKHRERLFLAVVNRFVAQYDQPLVELEARLARGEGSEHPDWEDSIEWRNAEEALQGARLMRRLLEWLLPSISPSLAS